MGSIRVKGTKLSIYIDSKEYKGDVTSYEFSNDEKSSDVVTFEDMENGNGGLQYKLTLGLVQSTDAASLWMKLWENTGKQVYYRLAPHGNETASAAQPHFGGYLTIPAPPTLGGDAEDVDYTTTVECTLDAKPTKITSGKTSVVPTAS